MTLTDQGSDSGGLARELKELGEEIGFWIFEVKPARFFDVGGERKNWMRQGCVHGFGPQQLEGGSELAEVGSEGRSGGGF